MTLNGTTRPLCLTFDCYGTLIQWDEGLREAMTKILAREHSDAAPSQVIAIYDQYEHELEQISPHRSFRDITRFSLELTCRDLGLRFRQDDADLLTGSISTMPPFPEVAGALSRLKQAGFHLCIISNTDDEIIAGNVRQLGGMIDRVITAEQAGAYKPSRQIFDYAHRQLGVARADVLHICGSPLLDLVASRDLGFRCVWIDRGTGRQRPADYIPDAVLPSLDLVPPLLAQAGWM